MENKPTRHTLAFNRLVTLLVTAGGVALGAWLIQSASPGFYTAAFGTETSFVGMIAGGISGFLMCASALEL